MTENPLVSVCIPAYNAEKYIAKAIDSILTQTYENIEIIVCNDGSTDRTAAILESYALKGVKVVHQQVGYSASRARNIAYKHSKGNYIKFFDADDVLSPEFIELQIRKIAGKDNAIVSSEWGRFYQDDISTFRHNPETVWKDMKPIDWIVESMKNGPNMMQPGIFLIPKRIVDQSGLWNETLSPIDDFEFFVRSFLIADDILFAKNAIMYYRSGITNSLSGKKTRLAMESMFFFTELSVNNLLTFENTDRVRKVCADCFQLRCYNFYPLHMDLYRKSNDWVNKLGGSTYRFPAGGYTKVICNLIGWKFTTKLKLFINYFK